MCSIFDKFRYSSHFIAMLNLEHFLQHLKDSFHIPEQNGTEDVQSLLKHCARRNKESPRKPTTCFLIPRTTPHGKVYMAYEKDELLHILKQTLRSGQKRPNRRGHIEATYSFNTCVGIYCLQKWARRNTRI